ncbi:MAG: adenosine deaminase [Solirubrobacteraceae bacterium]|jgi:adenosine deaminase|nr:adenosine deaminase [Solirubrobacteraceae bacterium]
MPTRRWLTAFTSALLLATGGGAGAVVAQAAAPGAGERRTARQLESIRHDPFRLHAFLAAMPKGGDLHNHLSGAVPTETLIGYAVEDGLCIDSTTLTAMSAPAPGASCPAGQRPAADSSADGAFFGQILRAWSMAGFAPGAETGHDHFFATFGKFGLATVRKGDMLAAVARINAAENVLYLETLVSRQGDAVRAVAQQVGFDSDFAAMRAKLLAGGMAQIVSAASEETDADVARFDELLGCRTPHPRPACRLVWRYDYQVGRATDPEIVFTNLLLGFELQRTDPRYVGVNLVQPEDNAVALRDYTLQMRMIRYLRSVYPRAHVTLHAGELAPGLVAPADLRFHIRQAVDIAGAERIGHGVDLVHEQGYTALLRTMARRHVLVEAPLTSNAQILGVSGPAHPFMRYRAAGVPVALATDDPGVSRIDLTDEYALAATEYDLHYRDLKNLARASLDHAFLPGRSLWLARDVYRRRAACARDSPAAARPGPRCRAFLRTSAKATVQWRQETRLSAFERRR